MKSLFRCVPGLQKFGFDRGACPTNPPSTIVTDLAMPNFVAFCLLLAVGKSQTSLGARQLAVGPRA